MLHLIDTGGPGGAETVFLDLARELARRGWQSIVVVPERDWLHHRARSAGFEPLVIRASRSFDLAYLRTLRSIVRDRNVDLVQTHLLGTSVYGTLACMGTKVPVVSTFHGRPDIRGKGPGALIKNRLLRSDRNRVVCVSESLRTHFIATGALPESARVIHNGVEFEAIATPAGPELRDELNVPGDAMLVGAIGNVRPSKGYSILLRAFARVRSDVPTAHLVVAGQHGGPLGEHLLRESRELGLNGAVHFLGFRSDVSTILRQLDVFALASLDEGFSLAIVQAMASGLPVVATRSGGPEEIVGAGGPAMLVPPGDPTALARALVEVLVDRDLAHTLGHAAREHVRDRFTIGRMGDRYEQLYGEILDGLADPGRGRAAIP